jgi:hypothetical protein
MSRILSLVLTGLLLLTFAVPATAASPRPDGIPETYDLVAENENFQFYVNAETLAFKVLDKRSNYLWHSNLDEKIQGDRLNKTWTAFAQSGVSIDYLDQKANSSRASITNAEHSLQVERIENGIQAQVTFSQPAISLTVRLQLEADGVRVEVPFDGIQESGDYRLEWLHLYPWMGATRRAEVDGYMFLPDGCGSLIRFTEQTAAQNIFYGRYYGPDLGMLGSLKDDPTLRRPYPLSLPVIGMVYGAGQNAYLAVIEQGAAYAEVRAHPAGIITNFNFLYNAFLYNESYFQRTNRAGDGVTVLQPQTNRYDIVLHYRFLTGKDASYVGMARSYRQYLLEKGLLHPATEAGAPIGIRLEFLGAEREKILFWNRTIPMTRVEQMRAILETLQVKRPQVVYYGWQPGGASAMFPRQLKLDSKLGALSDLQALAADLEARGGSLNLYYDPLAALTDAPASYSRYDLAMAITNITISSSLRGKMNYYFNLPALTRRFSALSQDVQQRLPTSGLALDHISSVLFSDFRRGQTLNREETIAAYQNLFAESNIPLAFYTPNAYLLPYANAYYDIPLTSSGYTYAEASVPFLPIVLSGIMPYYGEALNFSPDVRTDLLRHAEYGAYPSFFVTYEETARILKTRSSWIYVSQYRQLQEEIETSYAWLNALLQPVQGAAIVDHEQVAPQVFATTYSNGRQILVNYRDRPVTVYGLTIPARDAVLREVQP